MYARTTKAKQELHFDCYCARTSVQVYVGCYWYYKLYFFVVLWVGQGQCDHYWVNRRSCQGKSSQCTCFMISSSDSLTNLFLRSTDIYGLHIFMDYIFLCALVHVHVYLTDSLFVFLIIIIIIIIKFPLWPVGVVTRVHHQSWWRG